MAEAPGSKRGVSLLGHGTDRLSSIWSGRSELVRGGDPSAPLQRLLPGTRILCAGLLLLIVIVTGRAAVLAGVCVLCTAAARLGRLQVRAYLTSILLLTGVFVAPVAMLGALSVFHPGPAGPDVSVGPFSGAGLRAAGFLCLRALAAVSVTTLLVRSAGIQGVFEGLRALRFPETLLAVLQMTFTHIHLLGRLAEGMLQGVRARTLERPSLGTAYRSVASQGGILLQKSMASSRDVHGAMLARGFTGTFPLARDPGRKWRGRDVMLVTGCAVAAVLVVGEKM